MKRLVILMTLLTACQGNILSECDRNHMQASLMMGGSNRIYRVDSCSSVVTYDKHGFYQQLGDDIEIHLESGGTDFIRAGTCYAIMKRTEVSLTTHDGVFTLKITGTMMCLQDMGFFVYSSSGTL